MTRARKACPQPRCPNLQPCPEHTPKAWAGSTRRSRLPGNWDRIRRYVLMRDELCQVCHEALAVEVDHIVPGDNHDYDNLQGICVACHKAKTQEEAQRARTA